MKHIRIELSPESCAEALKELKTYRDEIKPKLDEICRRLAAIGAQAARDALWGEYGNTDAVVEPIVKIRNGYKIVMSGADVYFVEFGTGDDVKAHYNPSVSVSRGSWSQTHAQKYSTYGYWYYGGDRLYGTPAQMPMYHAEKAIRANARRVAQEVLGR